MAVIAREAWQSVNLGEEAFKFLSINPTDCFTTFAMTSMYSFYVITVLSLKHFDNKLVVKNRKMNLLLNNIPIPQTSSLYPKNNPFYEKTHTILPSHLHIILPKTIA
jgi:hypothetical protein